MFNFTMSYDEQGECYRIHCDTEDAEALTGCSAFYKPQTPNNTKAVASIMSIMEALVAMNQSVTIKPTIDKALH